MFSSEASIAAVAARVRRRWSVVGAVDAGRAIRCCDADSRHRETWQKTPPGNLAVLSAEYAEPGRRQGESKVGAEASRGARADSKQVRSARGIPDSFDATRLDNLLNCGVARAIYLHIQMPIFDVTNAGEARTHQQARS